MAQFDVQAIAPLFDTATGDTTLKQELGLAQVYVLTLPGSSDVQETLAALAADPAVEYAEPDYIGYGAGTPDDQYFDLQWNLHNTGQSGGEIDADVDGPEAWDVSTGLTSTVIAVIDTGIDLDHPDLAEKLTSGYDFVNDQTTPQDDHGHGTHVSGIAAAVTNNETGMAGMCPSCRVMPIKALNDENWGYYSWWISAIEYAVDNGADVINMSMGGTDESSLLHDAVLYAYHAGVPIVAAMMNDGDSTLYYPAAYTETIAVGATDRYDDRWSDSNYGEHVDLVAPGEKILSTLWDDTYAIWDGTSEATPHVAGVLGLIHSVRPGYTVEELRAILRATADDQVGPPNEDKQGWDQYFGAGRLNAARAVQLVVPPAEVAIQGPTTGDVLTDYTFVAAVGPVTASQPITYAWRATGQPPVTHTGGLSDTTTFAWPEHGTQLITVTVTNFGGTATDTHAISINDPAPPGPIITVCHDGGCDFDTIQGAVDAARDGDVIKVAAGIYTGVNDYGSLAQVVYVDKTITIRGGYTPAFADPPHPDANPTTIDAQNGGRALYITGDISPTIEGLRITGGDAAGLEGGQGGGDAGGGISVVDALATISNTYVFSNTARWGGGVYLWASGATFIGNTINDNAARWGGGLYLETGSDAALVGNCLSANTAEKDGGGLYLRESDATLHSNVITANTAGEWGGGLYVYQSETTLSDNDIAFNVSATDGGGVYLWKSSASLAENTIIANVADQGGGLYLANSDATLANNVVANNQAGAMGAGLYVQGSAPRLLHTTIARNGGAGDGSGVYVTGEAGSRSTVALTNTILVDHAVGITVTGGNTASLEATLWGQDEWANATDWAEPGPTATIRLARNYWGDPAFVEPDAGDYHIGPGSAARDAGVNAGVTTDIDGALRPVGPGYDIGADECTTGLSVSQRASPNPVQAGARLTYTIRVTNTGSADLHATIADVLPSHVTSNGPHTWTPTIAASGPAWEQTLVVTVEVGYAGPLTNVVQVTTAEGATGTDTSTVTAIAADYTTTVGPSQGGTISAAGADGTSTVIEIPAGAVTEPTQLAYTSLSTVAGVPAGLHFAGRAFGLDVYRHGTLHPGLVFVKPITITIHYAEADVVGLDESTLELRRQSGITWSSECIVPVAHDLLNNEFVSTAEHAGTFAIFAQELQSFYTVYLPLVQRQ
jgi:thermitase